MSSAGTWRRSRHAGSGLASWQIGWRVGGCGRRRFTAALACTGHHRRPTLCRHAPRAHRGLSARACAAGMPLCSACRACLGDTASVAATTRTARARALRATTARGARRIRLAARPALLVAGPPKASGHARRARRGGMAGGAHFQASVTACACLAASARAARRAALCASPARLSADLAPRYALIAFRVALLLYGTTKCIKAP